MEITRMNPEHYTSPLPRPRDRRELTLLWCEDGWCYAPERKVRYHYNLGTQVSSLLYIEEPWEGTIAYPMYTERVTWTLYSLSPLIWRERSEEFDELYVGNRSRASRE